MKIIGFQMDNIDKKQQGNDTNDGSSFYSSIDKSMSM